MILFFGTKLGKKETKSLANIPCPHCSQVNTLTATSQASYIHLFWIPLFKIGTSQYLECSHCKRVYYKEEFTDEIRSAL
ncbi:zinc-ribbon domain-containing protein [Flagellimonas maritima]|uniref:zinc-ribbon domain-containing protein n=1 Tax=Flagellimonas maritima TaxID=1383885 RepID=UPI000DD7DB4F|nr:zinc-ribbon domain-containing protein [Allomuricauda aurantiaca]